MTMSTFSVARRVVGALCVSGALLLAGPARAQDEGEGPGSTGPQPGGAPTAVPIDGGASLLLASGAAFALKQLRRRRK